MADHMTATGFFDTAKHTCARSLKGVLLLCIVYALYGCANPQVYSTVQHQAISLEPDSLPTHGIAFITPSTVTGQEEDKQALALIFADVLAEEHPDITIVTLPETLGAVARNDLTDEYKHMFDDFKNSGIFDRIILRKVGEVTGVRYLAQLKLANFSQGTISRWSLLGIRMSQTKYANIRLFFQIWDSVDGTIAWEGVDELNYAHDTSSERAVAFRTVIETAARNLISQLPREDDQP